MVIGLGAALLAAVLFGAGAAVQAVAARRRGLISWLMVVVGLIYGLGWLLHLVSIALVPLYVAQVGVAASLAVTALIAATVVREPLGARDWVAIAVLVGGLGALAVAAGNVGSHRFEREDTIALWLGLLLVLGLGLVAARVQGHRGGVLLGYTGGLAYSGSPVATRALVDPAWDVETIAPALTIGLFGLLGFVLYSLALRRTSITAASAPLVLLQTVIPAVVGVMAFGDTVRSGWWPMAVVGFTASTMAAVALRGAETRLERLERRPEDPMVGLTT